MDVYINYIVQFFKDMAYGYLNGLKELGTTKAYILVSILITLFVLRRVYKRIFSQVNVFNDIGLGRWFNHLWWLTFWSVVFQLWVVALVWVTLFLGTIILAPQLYPQEWFEFLDRSYGRIISERRFGYLIDDTAREELMDAVTYFARNRIGATILVAKSSTLDDIIETGDYVGEHIPVTSKYLRTVLSDKSEFNKGAIVIRDNQIVAVNCNITTEASGNTFKGLNVSNRVRKIAGAINSNDCIGIAVNEATGKISLAGWLSDNVIANPKGKKTKANVIGNSKPKQVIDYEVTLKDFDVQNGIDKQHLILRFNSFLNERGSADIVQDMAQQYVPTREEIKQKQLDERDARRHEAELKRQEQQRKREEMKLRRQEEQEQKRQRR